MNKLPAPGRYRHFKGGEYEVIDVALHSESEQAHVVYRPLYGEGRLWVRPLDLFVGEKIIDGRPVPRFQWVGPPNTASEPLQGRVLDFCRQHGLQATPAARLLDLCSELGELAKVCLQGTAYGARSDFAPDRESWQAELGDTLFAVLCLANESGVDVEQALNGALERYRRRIEATGHPGSDH